jgi:3',5'-cyclic AMP phosphodiesterase CpdA
VRLAHLSDIHIHNLENVRPWRFLNKRATGGLNLLLGRSGKHDNAVVQAALDTTRDLGVDHTVVTGDLSNLSLESEFEAARAMLEPYSAALSVIPGNHDYYTRGSVRSSRFESYFAPWMASDVDLEGGAEVYPYAKLLGDQVALVGINSCIVSPPTFAVGRVGEAQLDRLDRLLGSPALQDRFVVAATHHHLVPPLHTNPRKEFFRQMQDREAVKAVLTKHGVGLAIHGHNHQHGLIALDRPDGGTTWVAEAGSTSVAKFSDPHYGGKFNVYDIVDGALRSVETWLFRPDAAVFTPWRTWTRETGWSDPSA